MLSTGRVPVCYMLIGFTVMLSVVNVLEQSMSLTGKSNALHSSQKILKDWVA